MSGKRPQHVLNRDELSQLTRSLARNRAKRGLFIALLFGAIWIAGHLYAGGIALAHSKETILTLEGNLYSTAVAPDRAEYRWLTRLLLEMKPLKRLTAAGRMELTLVLDTAPFETDGADRHTGVLEVRSAENVNERPHYLIHLHPIGVEPIRGPVELFCAAFGQATALYLRESTGIQDYGDSDHQRQAAQAQMLLIDELSERGLPVSSSYRDAVEAGLFDQPSAFTPSIP